MAKGRSKSSKEWLQRQQKDTFVKQAHADGYRSRSAYKLIEIGLRDKIFKPGMTVVDLGAAPGGWSQVAKKQVAPGKVYALDILPIDPIEGVDIILGDFREEEVLAELLNKLGTAKVGLVISDMAPNFSGMSGIDLPRAVYLAEIALDFALEVLEPSGTFVVKLFQGVGFTEYVQQMKESFRKVVARKPKSSRSESREVYLVGTGLLGGKKIKRGDS